MPSSCRSAHVFLFIKAAVLSPCLSGAGVEYRCNAPGSAEPIHGADSTKGNEASLKKFTLWLGMFLQSGWRIQVLGERVYFAS